MSGTTDGRSRQLRIADDLRAKIESGEFQPGDRLPGLPDLANTYGVSLVTVRHAISKLKQEGLVVSQQGKGNFVRKKLRVRRYGIERYSRSVWGGEQPKSILEAEGDKQGRNVGQATEADQVPAPAFVAERLLGVAEGDLVHVRRRVTTIDGVINQSADSYFTLALGEQAPVLVTGRGRGGHIARINAISPVLEIQEELEARMPTAPESALLEIPEGTPVVEVIRTYHTEMGPLDVTRFIIRADMAAFDYRFLVPD
ncbi:GntR family transcriptional regulator [Streptosporangium sp. CA-115845]|uniref:GntR family transcriptional regulator n=1 Tax=Streptosporangium sp. CA-115845 TaxID=3240071 RepID=UPI003D8BD40D